VLSAGIRRRRELQAALDTAIAESRFTVVYQPIVELTSGGVAGFETLARWPHPQWGMIPPEQFIAVAEETGHIIRLGRWVLERAAAGTVRREQAAPHQPPRYVSVNVSARQLRDPEFVPGVQRILASTGLDPEMLLLELTESVLLRPDQRICGDLAELRRMGFGWPSTTSAPVIPRSATCVSCRSACSRSTSRSWTGSRSTGGGGLWWK
jgi:EAL domain-containing protein (putative c-di-GMP-specific phosphodiesterase class I)